jgi:hypothetical protein
MPLCEFIQSDEFTSLCEFIQSDEFTSLCEFIQSDEFTSLYKNSYIIWIRALLAQFPICGCDYFLHYWHSEGGFFKVIIVETSLSNNIILFGMTDVLETLTYKVEQWWTVFRECKEVLRLKSCLIGHDVSGYIQMAMLYTKHMAFQKNIRV